MLMLFLMALVNYPLTTFFVLCGLILAFGWFVNAMINQIVKEAQKDTKDVMKFLKTTWREIE